MRVVVVGSGMAGVAAAATLSKHSRVEVIILEAMERVGGRIHTIQMAGHPIDLGASWLHDTLENPLFNRAVDKGINVVYDDEIFRFYTSEGAVPASLRAHGVLRDIEDSIGRDYHEIEPTRSEVSLRDYVEKFVAQAPLLTAQQRQLAAAMMQKNEHFAAQPWEHIPANEAEVPRLRSGRNAFVLAGMSTIWDLVWSSRVPDRVNVKLGTRVQRIVQESNKCVVHTATDSWECDYVVCTIPLGALKNGPTFNPPLPQPLLQTIATTDVAALGKVIFIFPYKFWDLDPDELNVLGLGASDRPVSFVNVWHHFSHGAVLVALTGPPLTQYVEKYPENAFSTLKWALDAIRSDRTRSIPEPLEVGVTNWTQNPLFAGSYSARSIGQSWPDMIQPYIDGDERVRFAGEHTVYDGNGCVHGAWASGIREAQYILAKF